jgi:hypothetical protein
LFTFESGEEKLIGKVLFYGISNMIMYGFHKGHKNHIEDWPILPDGDYELRVALNAYQNENYEMVSSGKHETINFQYS